MNFSRENMNWFLLEIRENPNFISPSLPPPQPPLSLRSNSDYDLNSKISPSILLIIIILSIIFFISGLLHLLVRFLLTPSNRNQDDFFDSVTALQGQLQQLFHLHDSGVDQSYIDTLPVFHYKSIIGLKNYPFDCAVCLCEFEPEDKLRLLPKCSHAFHMDCIDTWLLSHSTCPLCRSSLLSDFSSQFNSCSPYLLVLESGSDHGSREIVTDRDSACVADGNGNIGRSFSCLGADSHSHSNSHLGFDGNHDLGSTPFDSGRKSCWVPRKDDEIHDPDAELANSDEKIVPFPVKLGKFRNVDVGEGSSNTNGNNNGISNSSNVDERRCFSMGSYEYIMDEESILKVHVSRKKQRTKNPGLPGHRAAMSECGGDSTRGFKFNGLESMRIAEEARGEGIVKDDNNKESFSVSKIWLRGKEKKQNTPKDDCSSASSSKRSFSFRFPIQRNSSDAKSCEMGCDEENQKSENFESLETKTPSFARRTMLWLVGRQNKVVHSSAPSTV